MTSLVTVGALAPSTTRAQESKTPVTEVVNNKGLHKDSLELSKSDSAKTIELLDALSRVKGASVTQQELLDEVLGRLSDISENNKTLVKDNQKTYELLETLENIINAMESDVVQAEQPNGMQKGFDKLVKTVGLDKAVEYAKNIDTLDILTLISAIGLTGGAIAATRASEKRDDTYNKDYNVTSSLCKKSTQNEINEAYNYVKDSLGIKSDDEFKSFLKLPIKEFEKELFARLEKNKNV